MIDITREQLIELQRVPGLLPATARPSYGTAWRWVTSGVGGLRLEAVRLGRRWFTSVEAVNRFGEALAQASEPAGPAPKQPRTRTETEAARRHAAAVAELRAAGV